MNDKQSNKQWQVLSSDLRIDSPWLRLYQEKLLDDSNQELDYWRVEKPDGILIITVQNNKILLPKPMYRPGVKSYTLDLCGGRRINPNNPLERDAKTIVKRALGIDNDSSFEQMKLLDKDGWNRDSSFSNVKIYVFLATLAPDTVAHSLYQDKQFAADYRGITNLLSRIECMQCRLALREWQSLLVQIAGF